MDRRGEESYLGALLHYVHLNPVRAGMVDVAAVIKRHTSVTNVWITGRLNMGISQAVSQNVGKFYAAGDDETEAYQKLIINIPTCPLFLLSLAYFFIFNK